MTERTGSRWKDVWARREVTPQQGSTLAQLLAADGYDTGFGTLAETSWIDFVRRRANDLGIGPGSSVFEVGCGAGALLFELRRLGCAVGGIDWSPSLIRVARSVLPGADFEVKEASMLDVSPRVDVVLACSLFHYFPSLEYAMQVIERMVAKSVRAVAIFDLPDQAVKEAALAYRRASAGGDVRYAARYEGLDHCYFDRSWVADTLQSFGLTGVQVADQDFANYGNAPYRFNAWGFKHLGR